MALDDDVAFLARVPILATFGAEGLRILAISAETRTLASGEILFREGEDAEGGFVIVSGALGLKSVLDPDRGEYVAQAGALVGEAALITPTRWPTTAIARDPTMVMRIPRHVVRRVLESLPQAADTLRALMIDRLNHTQRDLGRIRHRLEAFDRVAQKPDWV